MKIKKFKKNNYTYITAIAVNEYNKEIEKYKNNTFKESVYYYYDKECTKPIPGLIKSNKMKIVKHGSCMIEQPYKITERVYFK